MAVLDTFQQAVQSLHDIWEDFHTWFSSTDHSTMKRNRRLIKSTRKETRQCFYKEIRKKAAMKHMAWNRILDMRRFDAFSDVFYNQTRVDVEFARRKIYQMLR